ncbi:MAG: transcription termination/antitermination protein NusG [Alphaproteobacteria bacterium]|nr:transcription termination/antitermination protein NusG [Alphaproteobacteria bacterium]
MEEAKWYIVHAYSGFESKVAQAIREKAAQENLSDLICDVIVPTEEVVEVKRGKKQNTKRKFLPGYILVKMVLNDTTWHFVKNVPKVTGFLGGKGKPYPVPDSQVQSILRQVEEGIANPRHTRAFDVGESVKVTDGPFESFIGVVEEVDSEKNRVKVAVSIFGRATPVELEFDQVEKLD